MSSINPNFIPNPFLAGAKTKSNNELNHAPEANVEENLPTEALKSLTDNKTVSADSALDYLSLVGLANMPIKQMVNKPEIVAGYNIDKYNTPEQKARIATMMVEYERQYPPEEFDKQIKALSDQFIQEFGVSPYTAQNLAYKQILYM